ncbi:uncharacterized protein LOC122074146 [Macadamia integrifolia]|uniref:uncharacterized protein LOC122074146 n=1 Tax=Macadamia integrifolia TaxID=60698 RepID=UPI001C4E6859|nr:uncharacterized protein LOC122074146 [Macadamia integrifolia]
MALLRSACLVLGLLLTSLGLRDSAVVHAQQATGKAIAANENKDGIGITRVDAAFVSKELFEGTPPATAAATAIANKRLGGRKVLQGSILRKKMMEEETMNGKIPKISGKDKNTSKKPLGTLHKYMNDQKSSQLKSQDSDDQAVSNCGSLECSSSSRKIVSPEFHDHFHKTDQSKKLFEASNDKVMSLTHIDYSGMSTPHCKPPINNHLPKHQIVKP